MAHAWSWCFWSVCPAWPFPKDTSFLSPSSPPSFPNQGTVLRPLEALQPYSYATSLLAKRHEAHTFPSVKGKGHVEEKEGLTLSCNVVPRSVVTLDNREKAQWKLANSAISVLNLSKTWRLHRQNENSIRHFPEKGPTLNKIMHTKCLVSH